MGQTTKIETYRFEHYGDQTVRTAADLIAKLPNGWTLVSLNYVTEYGIGSWIAIVRGPKRDLETGEDI